MFPFWKITALTKTKESLVRIFIKYILILKRTQQIALGVQRNITKTKYIFMHEEDESEDDVTSSDDEVDFPLNEIG